MHGQEPDRGTGFWISDLLPTSNMLPPIQLPKCTSSRLRIHLPTAPQNPPTDDDVLSAMSYKRWAKHYNDHGKSLLNTPISLSKCPCHSDDEWVTSSDVVEAHVYKFNILQAKSRASALFPVINPLDRSDKFVKMLTPISQIPVLIWSWNTPFHL